jgi:hypothetical protein
MVMKNMGRCLLNQNSPYFLGGSVKEIICERHNFAAKIKKYVSLFIVFQFSAPTVLSAPSIAEE